MKVWCVSDKLQLSHENRNEKFSLNLIPETTKTKYYLNQNYYIFLKKIIVFI